MAHNVLNWFRRCDEFILKDEVTLVPPRVRGLYVLYKHRRKDFKDKYDVVYVGMAAGPKSGIRGRLVKHLKKKGALWTHFSVFQVRPEITSEEVKELEGFLRHIYRKDTKANRLNVQKEFKKMRTAHKNLNDWDCSP